MKSIPRSGISHMLIATMCFSLMNVCVKMVNHLPVAEVVLFRCLFSLIISFYMLKRVGLSPWGNHRKVLILRGLLGGLALLTFFYTVQQLNLATAVTIQYLSPVFTAVFAVFLLKEKFHPWQWLFFGLSFSGCLLAGSFDHKANLTVVLIGIASAALSALAYNSVRFLKDSEHPLVIVFYYPLVAAPLALILSIPNWQNPIGIDWLWLVGVGIATQLGQFHLTKSLQSSDLSKVSILNYLGIIYSVVLGFFLFNEKYSLWILLAFSLVFIGVILNTWYKNRMDGRHTNKKAPAV